MLAPPPAPLIPFTLCETHGIFELPGCRVHRSGVCDRAPMPAIRPAPTKWRSRSARGQSGSGRRVDRSEEHTSELQSLMRISYAVFCLKKKQKKEKIQNTTQLLNNTT